MKKIIGIAALARSGKDTVASLLLQHNNVSAYALADPLKLGCQALFGLTEDETWDDSTKENTIPLWQHSPREFFQHIGTEWMRAHNPEHWLMRAERAINYPVKAAPMPLTRLTQAPRAVFKLASQAFFGLSNEQTWEKHFCDVTDQFWGLSPRQMFNLIESLINKDFPDYFERRMHRPIILPSRSLAFIDKSDAIIIKDIRFENEADFLRRHNGIIWHIIRNNAQKVNPHASEGGIKTESDDIVIYNDGTLEQLAITVEQEWLGFMAK